METTTNNTEKKKDVNKIRYDVCKAHNNMQTKQVDNGKKQTVINFLKKQRTPYNFDVRASHWDGITWEFSFHQTGDEFLKDPDCLDYVTIHTQAVIEKYS